MEETISNVKKIIVNSSMTNEEVYEVFLEDEKGNVYILPSEESFISRWGGDERVFRILAPGVKIVVKKPKSTEIFIKRPTTVLEAYLGTDHTDIIKGKFTCKIRFAIGKGVDKIVCIGEEVKKSAKRKLEEIV